NRNRIAAFDLQTGNLTSWNPSASSTVGAIAASGANVYVGGYFATIGGRSRPYLAALSVTTGVATGWNPAPAGPTTYVGAVDVLAVSAETVYAGGHFTNIGGMPRNFLAALDVNTGLATSWNPDIGTPACTGCQVIRTLQVSSNTVYVGGSFQ